MEKNISQSLFCLGLWGCLATTTVTQAQAPVYLNLGSHNETNDPYNYVGNSTDYTTVKNLVLQIADTIIKYDARWNMQVESNFIRGCIAHDNAFTDNDDLLQWADSQAQIEVDPHNHFVPFPLNSPSFNPYNYTDLNYLLTDSCGLSLRTNLGGFLWRDFTNPAASEDWTQFQNPVNGAKFPLETWRPQVIWGGGSPSHQDDFNALGIWKPKAATSAEFGAHEPSNYLYCIGSNCGNAHVIFDTTDVNDVINETVRLINYAQAVGNANTDFYALTIMFNFRNIEAAGMVDKIAQFVRAMQPYADQGKLVWATLTEKYDTWTGAHNANDFFVQMCDSIDLSVAVQNTSNNSDFTLYPNPTHSEQLTVEIPASQVNGTTIEIVDLMGVSRISPFAINSTTNTFSLQHLAAGMYICRLYNSITGNTSSKPFVVGAR